jgi:hypothetical protein
MPGPGWALVRLMQPEKLAVSAARAVTRVLPRTEREPARRHPVLRIELVLH